MRFWGEGLPGAYGTQASLCSLLDSESPGEGFPLAPTPSRGHCLATDPKEMEPTNQRAKLTKEHHEAKESFPIVGGLLHAIQRA